MVLIDVNAYSSRSIWAASWDRPLTGSSFDGESKKYFLNFFKDIFGWFIGVKRHERQNDGRMNNLMPPVQILSWLESSYDV